MSHCPVTFHPFSQASAAAGGDEKTVEDLEVVRRMAGLVKGLVGGQVARTLKAELDLLSKKRKTYTGRNKRLV
jgi:hypothetical protein